MLFPTTTKMASISFSYLKIAKYIYCSKLLSKILHVKKCTLDLLILSNKYHMFKLGYPKTLKYRRRKFLKDKLLRMNYFEIPMS